MLRYTLPARVISRLFLFSLVIFFILAVSAFNNPGKIAGKTLQVDRLAATNKTTVGISAIPHFKMSKAIMDKYGSSWDRRIILQFSLKDVSAEVPRVDLISYLATSQDDHAEGEIPDQLEPLTDYLPLDRYQEVILGNNYIHLKELNQMINSLPDKEYDHIRFIPMMSTKYPGYIAFGIKIYGANNTKLSPYGGKTMNEIDAESNPSPPASPDGN